MFRCHISCFEHLDACFFTFPLKWQLGGRGKVALLDAIYREKTKRYEQYQAHMSIYTY